MRKYDTIKELYGIENCIKWLCENAQKNNKIVNLRKVVLSNVDFRYAKLSGVDFDFAELSNVDFRYAKLSGVDFDFSNLEFSCCTLKAQFDEKIIIQILFHGAKPCEDNENIKDPDLIELVNLDLFKKVVNKFHRVEEVGEFKGVNK